jgi:type III pantothenate kinase
MAAPPLLLIDAGNTLIKWATTQGRGKIVVRGERVTSGASATWCRKLACEFAEHRVVLASVVPKLTPFFRRAFAGRIQVVTGTSPSLQLAFDYPKPTELGADRLAAAVAVHAEGRFPAIIISCGTATAFTVLDARGRLCGGAIAPGLQTQLAALLGLTAQLPATGLQMPRRLPARSTQDAIRAGVLLNFQGGVKEIVARLTKSLGGKSAPRLLLTGGHAHALRGVLGAVAEVRPLLVFEGLRIMGARLFPHRP